MFDLCVVAQLVAFNGFNRDGTRECVCSRMWGHFCSHSALISISAAEVCVESSLKTAVSASSDAEIMLECCFAVGETMSGHEQQRREAVPLQDHRLASHQLPGI